MVYLVVLEKFGKHISSAGSNPYIWAGQPGRADIVIGYGLKSNLVIEKLKCRGAWPRIFRTSLATLEVQLAADVKVLRECISILEKNARA
jgi:hypothetical protein